MMAAVRQKDEELTIKLKCLIGVLMTDRGLICFWRRISSGQAARNARFGFCTDDGCRVGCSLFPVGHQTSVHVFIYICQLFMSLPYGCLNLAFLLFRKRRTADFIKPEYCLPCLSSEHGRGIKHG